MNEELKKALTEMLKAIQAGKDFVIAEAPDVIQQLIRWSFWEAALWAAIGGVGTVVALRSLYRLWLSNQLTEWEDAGNPMCFLAPVGLGVLAALSAITFISNASVALKIYIAPKVWLIEWAMRQVKS